MDRHRGVLMLSEGVERPFAGSSTQRQAGTFASAPGSHLPTAAAGSDMRRTSFRDAGVLLRRLEKAGGGRDVSPQLCGPTLCAG